MNGGRASTLVQDAECEGPDYTNLLIFHFGFVRPAEEKKLAVRMLV